MSLALRRAGEYTSTLPTLTSLKIAVALEHDVIVPRRLAAEVIERGGKLS